MIERIFKLTENKTSVRTEVLAGVTTFLTMSYIIVVQPAVLSGKMLDTDTGLDFGAGLALGFISYAVVKAFSGRAREISWLTYLLAIVFVLYFVFVQAELASADSGFLRLWSERQRRRRSRFKRSTSKRRNPPAKRIPEVYSHTNEH